MAFQELYKEAKYMHFSIKKASVWFELKIKEGKKEIDLPVFRDPDQTWIDERAEIGAGTIIFSGCTIAGKVTIGKNCILWPGVFIASIVSMAHEGFPKETKIGDNCILWPGIYVNAHAHKNGTLGLPAKKNFFAEECVIIGQMAELNRSRLGKRVKMPHHGYVGDFEIGEDSNIGAGAITANFDGKNKHKTSVGARSSLGVNSNIIAPNILPEDTEVGGGSTIPQSLATYRDVPAGSVLISRPKEVAIKQRKKKE